jgi:tRNA nucleotidyltransferase (CCA-adding enzyme)
MQVYLVGGAVRDALLGLDNADRDWVVTGATPEEMLAQGYQQVGKDFPVFLHPQTREEYALARTERKSGAGHKGFVVSAHPAVTLEDDLLRRDLTINAIARDSNGTLVDPFGGQRDIETRVLRHVSPAFAEDPLRVLRVARFAARFASRGFTIAPETLLLMQRMTQSGELSHLPAERLWKEMETALQEESPAVFVEVLDQCGALQKLLPELYLAFTNQGIRRDTLAALRTAARNSPDPVVRFAVLLHVIEPPSVEAICARLRVPRDFLGIARLVSRYRSQCDSLLHASPEAVLDLLEALDAFRRPVQVELFLLSCEAVACTASDPALCSYPQGHRLRIALTATKKIRMGETLNRTGVHRDAELIRKEVRQIRLAAVRDALEHATDD